VRSLADRVIASLPTGLARAELSRYQRAVRDVQVVNFRSGAARYLLGAMGVGRAPEEFGRRAVAHIRARVADGECPAGLGGAGVDTARVFGYVEYDVVDSSNAGQPTDGHFFCECGRAPRGEPEQPGPGGQGPTSAWLHAFRLPNSPHVDRSCCAEFRILSRLCAILVPAGGEPRPHPSLVGIVALFTTTSPCMSCIGAIRQFQLLFPEVQVETSDRNEIGMPPGAMRPSHIHG